MSLTSELNKARRKRLEEEENLSQSNSPLYSRLNIAAGKAAAQKDEDIAPVKDTTKNGTAKSDERKWFEKGAFEDGYQFGDVLKTAYSTMSDVSDNVMAGILGIGEGVVDAGAYVAGGVGKLFGADEFAEDTKDFIAKDLYDEKEVAKKLNVVNNWTTILLNGGTDYEEKSVLGDKADSVVQSGGQLLGTAALQMAGVPWWVTTGVTSFGGEVDNAFDQGATYGEAGGSGLISAGAEILTEKLSGGIKFGGKTVGDALVQPLVDKISNKVVRTAVNLGLDALGEGGEEVISQICSNLGSALYKEESLDEILASEEALDGYIESFIGGAALGGGMGSVNAVNSIATGRDYKTGLTSNEQKVLDKEIENRIAEAESDGKKLTSTEKAKIEEEARSDLEKGYISTDTIESALGGKTYQAYQDAIANDEGAIKELETMFEGAELEQAIGGITKNSKQGELKAQTSKEVAELIKKGKDTFLSESYGEVEKRKQAFEADISKYDAKQQETIKRAVESGILNNTRKTHEFVDMIAKISADKGVSFDFTSNEKLAETGFAVAGKTVNGFVRDGTITTNIDSAKALNTVVGHEITHVLEGTEIYGELQKAITEYATTKGEYTDRLKAAIELYRDVDGYKGADGMEAIKREVVSDLVGEYLFTDADFVNSLSTKNRNLFQKIFDEIKYLCKMATAGSKEARQLEKVKHAFEQAYRGDKAKTRTKAETKTETAAETTEDVTEEVTEETAAAAEETEAPTEIAEEAETPTEAPTAETAAEAPTAEETEAVTDAPTAEIEAPTAETEAETGEKDSNGNTLTEAKAASLKNSKVRDKDGKLKVVYRTVSKHGGRGYETFESQYGNLLKGGVFTDTRSVAEADARKDGLGALMIGEKYLNITNPIDMNAKADAEAWKQAFPDASFPESGANWKFYGALEEYLTNAKYSKASIAETARAVLKSMGYDGITHKGGGEYGPHQVYVALETGQIQDMTDAASETESGTKFSLSDSDGKKLTSEQSEYFKDSKMRDENGALKVMYHGSQDAGFHTFDTRFSDDDTSFFFVDRNDVAASYSGTSETYAPRVFNVADDINKFFEEIGRSEYKVIESGGEYTLLDDGGEVATSDNLAEIYEEFCEWEGVGYGAANYKVYLNLTNPLVVDAEDRSWHRISSEFSQEIADRIQTLTAEEKEALHDLAEWEDMSIFRDGILEAANGTAGSFSDDYANALASAYEKLGDIDMYRLFDIATDNFTQETIKENALKYLNTRDYAQRAKKQGYDGVIFKNIHDNGAYSNGSEGASTVAIAFDSNQIKSVANETPTSDPDIRYSLSEDSEGRKLSEKQSKYFSRSKVVDENGNLKVVYHGSPADFSTFSLEYLGTNGTNEGYGFYFTDKKGIAEGYSKGDNGSGKLFEVYLDIRKPLSDTEVTMSRAQFKKLLVALNEQVDADGEKLDILSNYGDVEWDGLNNVLNYAIELEYDGNDNDVDIVHSVINSSGNMKTVFEVLRKVTGYDGIIVKEATWGGDQTIYIAFHPEQIKNVGNLNPTKNPDIRRSISENGETPKRRGNFNIYGKDVRLEAPTTEDIAPTAETETVDETVAPAPESSYDEGAAITEEEANAMQGDIDSLTDADAPPEMDAPFYEEVEETVDDPFENRDIKEVGNRKVKAYMYENPEVKPFFQTEANVMLGELQRSTKGERFYNDELYYETNGEQGFFGVKRDVSEDIAYLLDECKYTRPQIEKGLKAIIEDNGAENNAVSKRIEFLLNDRLLKGTTDFITGEQIPPNQDYINLLNEKQILEYSEEARKKFFEVADDYAPMPETEAAAETAASKEAPPAEDIAPVAEQYEAIRPPREKQPRLIKVTEGATETPSKTAEILETEPEAKKKGRGWAKFRTNFLDKFSVFEDLALKTKNRELMGKANQMLNAESAAQWLIGKGVGGVKSLNDIRAEVESSGLTKQFTEYIYHKHNIDRMSLEERYGTPNKAVFGDSVTADVSSEAVSKFEAEHPEFVEYAKDVYAYMEYLRGQLVNNGVISQETADLWAEMYPHYVPIRRVGDKGLNINVPLDTGRTGVNAPIKRATGGSSDILPLFDTMAMRTEQTFRAAAKNRFGVELKNTLNSTVESAETSLDEVIDGIDNHEGLLKKGENGRNPTFTVFEHGEKVVFEITEDMYDALKPTSDGLRYTNPIANGATNLFRGVITEYNPVFMATNAIKDAQDILMNSQHAAKTYANLPGAVWQLASKGKWYTEYMQNGGEQNTYFDGQTNTFKKEDNVFKKVVGMPFRAIQAANNFVERAPRLAEYMASRKKGASVEVAMLDAARVTTNFAAGGDVTKFLNRNGATFLNASVQGFNQQVRNIREAKANGLKGWTQLAAKTALAGLPALLLNNLLWDDDEEYDELSDYVKENYYVVAKYGDGQFVRIPKGRTVAVIQNAFEQVANAATGDDEIDLGRFLELAISNLAPNNPIDNNILSPIIQTANNKTWYGEDLVPTRLQDLPDAEQFDESTDAFSKWLGENTGFSPYKINYLLNQYGGGVADVLLPMGTPEAERGDDSLGGNLLAPFKDKFTTDGVMNNQNVTDFYSTVDELTKNAKSAYATDEDILKYKYMNSVNAELGELYQQKREIQNSDLSNAEKYEQAREIQRQIDEMTKAGLNTYGNVNIDGGYATVGDLHYRTNKEGEWEKISDKQFEKQEKVTNGLGISASEYWSNKEEYDYAYDYPEKYAVSKAVGGYEAYRTYSSELYDIKADKDENGKSISGSRKEKVLDYINNMDADYGEKIILFKSEYNADDTYNYDIIDYLNSREDISYSDMVTILKELGFTVHSDGSVTW